ncbi:GAF domain-containing protein, partial [bacterium]|nr:GAF domain-containing protein [bacterium]
LEKQVHHLLEGETDLIANAANFSSLLFYALPDLNWVGFYFYRNGELIVGPFQGRPACVHIPVGKGVCGAAAEKRTTVLVKNVHEFPGHIACDSASNSEIVIPLMKQGEFIGVLDMDSPVLARFDESDQKGLEKLAHLFLEMTDYSPIL